MILQDISPQQIEGHLRRQGLDALREVLAQSESLLQTVQRPLFFGLMIAVADKLRQGFRLRQDETWEDCIWRLYLDQCLDEKQANWNKSPDSYGEKYRKEQSMHWLHCLARWMQKEQKVELYIDELQPSMLKDYWRFGWFFGAFYSLIFGLACGLFLGASSGLIAKLTNVLLWSLIFLQLFMSIGEIEIGSIRPIRLPTSRQDLYTFSAKLAHWLLSGLSICLILGLIAGLFKLEGFGLAFWLSVMLAIMLAFALVLGAASSLKAVAGPVKESENPQERLSNAIFSSLLISPLFLLVGMTAFVQVLFLAEWIGIAVNPFYNMNRFYFVLSGTAINSFLALRTDTVLRHYLLRCCLRWEGQLPFRLVPWLDAVQQRKVLQRTGGSYRFLHKQLQEYLAKES